MALRSNVFEESRSCVMRIYYIMHEKILPYAESSTDLLKTKLHKNYEANALPFELAGPGLDNVFQVKFLDRRFIIKVHYTVITFL